MEFQKVEQYHGLKGEISMSEGASKFSDNLQVALEKALPDAIGVVQVRPMYGSDSLWVTVLNAPTGERKGVNFDNNRAFFTVENLDSPKVKLDKAGFFHVKTQTRIQMRAKTARPELAIKSIVKFVSEMSQLEPTLM